MKRTVWAMALASLAACGGTSGTSLPPTKTLDISNPVTGTMAYSPDGTRIAYGVGTSHGEDLVVARSDLSDPRVLMSGILAGNAAIVWSPDGRYISYVRLGASGPTAEIMNVDSGAESAMPVSGAPGLHLAYQWDRTSRLVAYVSFNPGGTIDAKVFSLESHKSTSMLQNIPNSVGFWSPNGAQIVYMVFSRGDSGSPRSNLWLTDSTGRPGRRLTTGGHAHLTGPFNASAWSPDGKSIVFVSDRTGKDDIWAWSVTGDSARQLTRDVLDDNNPVWSPDGKWVAFLSHRTRQWDLWLVPAKGGTARRITDTPDAESDPVWIPGTDTLTFTVHHSSAGLWLRSLDDSSERRITADSIDVFGWDLSPDGKRIALLFSRGGNTSLATVSVSGGPVSPLVPHIDGALGNPEWSPDGSRILYLAKPSRHSHVWIVDATGGTPRQLTTWSADDQSAHWSRDGSTVYVATFYSPQKTKQGLGATIWRVPADGGAAGLLTDGGGTGIMNDVETSPYSDDLFVTGLDGESGAIDGYMLRPDGTLKKLWDRTAVMTWIPHGFDPSGDSVMFESPTPNGGGRSMLISTATGEGHPMPEVDRHDVQGLDWAPDGRRLLFIATLGPSRADLAVYDRRTKKVTVLTHLPKTEGVNDARWLPDGRHLVFSRSTGASQVIAADLTKLMAGEN
ncbi:MAG TPA: hypothetical protein VJ992_06305 [Gemmatimonadales bacterium]|nr:hypothetical protein [Gemmatimonadales bacterium]